MLSISQFIQNLKSLNTNLYLVILKSKPLSLLETIPNDILHSLNNPAITDLINQLTEKSLELVDLLKPIDDKLQKHIKACQKKKTSNSNSIPYANFIVDEQPLLSKPKPEQLNFEDILKNDSSIKPAKRNRDQFTFDGKCPFCNAPHEYIYTHSNITKQYGCKVCKNLFTVKSTYHDEIQHYCPHCEYKLFLHHIRGEYDVLVCQNDNCQFYLKNKALLKENKAQHLKTNTNWHKLRYTFRLFHFNINEVNNNLTYNINSKIDLSKIQRSQYTLGLVLTYSINYGLSLRKTSQIMKEVHDIKISYQTVANYIEAVTPYTEELNKNYKYDLSNTIAGDETYIKVSGKNHYVFFFSDTVNKIITSYRIHPTRSTKNAVTAIAQTLKKYKTIPDDLKIITDGNPIYPASQIFFNLNNINFDLHQVIGLTNNNLHSNIYRPHKQVEERLNRIYKQNYYGTNGYGSIRNANVYISIWTTYFNFLREHSSLDNKVPVPIDVINNEKLMPNKWMQLIKYSQNRMMNFA